jgi:hypothetical protein
MNAAPLAYQTVALSGRADDPRVGEAMLVLAEHLLKRGRQVIAAAARTSILARPSFSWSRSTSWRPAPT